MRTRLTALADLSDRDVGAWRDLSERALEPNPFLEPDLVLPAEDRLGDGRAALLIVEDGSDWASCLPVQAVRWHGWRLPVLMSWRHSYGFLGTPLLDSGAPVAALGRVLDQALPRARAGMLALDAVGWDGGFAEALEAAMAERGRLVETYRSHERATLVQRREADYHEGMRPHHRRELRRLRRGLERLTGASLTTREVSGDPAAHERFLALERAGWKGRAGTAFASIPQHAEFFRTVCERFAGAGRLELLAFEAGEKTLAMKCNLRAGDAVFCFKIAFDEEFAKFSPGIQLELDNVERFHQGSATWMDSCAAPDHPMINRLWPDRRRIATVMLPSPGAAGHVSRCGARMARAWRTRERRPSWARS